MMYVMITMHVCKLYGGSEIIRTYQPSLWTQQYYGIRDGDLVGFPGFVLTHSKQSCLVAVTQWWPAQSGVVSSFLLLSNFIALVCAADSRYPWRPASQFQTTDDLCAAGRIMFLVLPMLYCTLSGGGRQNTLQNCSLRTRSFTKMY